MNVRLSGAVLPLLLSFGAPAAAEPTDTPSFEPRACTDPQLSAEFRCGIVRVAEDRDRDGGRTIALNIIVAPATSAVRLPPLFDLDGGPGLPATKNAGFYLTDGAAFRRERDIILIDQRGTGESNPLACPELSTSELHYQPMFPVDRVEACRDRLDAVADLARYGTDAAAADLDSVRRALGAEQIDIVALSYGTTLALRYLANYPGRARAVVLFGAAPPEAMPPRSHAPVAERALGLLFAACDAEAGCSAAFPAPREDLRRALVRLPSIEDAPAADVFLEKLRSLMYSPAGARAIPLVVNRAAQGDLAPFLARTRYSGPARLADGLYLSITCSESMAAMSYPQAAATSRRTLFGDYRLRRQREACAAWPKFEVAEGFLDPPVVSSALLLISGEFDPVTPPEWADAVAGRASNARHIVIAGGGHILDGLDAMGTCLDPLLLAFLDTADPAALDASCIPAMRPPAFATDSPPAS